MEADSFLFKEKTYQLIGAGMEVLNILGSGLNEKPYENALATEMQLRGIPFMQQPQYNVFYKSIKVGLYVPDFVAYGQIVIETKVIDRFTNIELGQTINYLNITGLKLGLIFNFKHPKLQWQRVVNQNKL